MGWLQLLPAAARPAAARCETGIRSGAGRDEIWPDLEDAISNTPDDEAVLDLYKRLLRISKYRTGRAPLLGQTFVDHLRMQSTRRRALQPDASVAHLAAAEAVFRGNTSAAICVLAELVADEVPLSSGSFDLIIQQAGRTRDRRTAYTSYRLLRRARLLPSAYTLNALMTAETRCGMPVNALSLLSRAERGSPRWPGAPPDAWSYTTGMAAASSAKRYLKVSQLFQRLTTDVKLRDRVTPTAYNLAIEARVQLKDRDGATRLIKRMQTGAGGAPPPQARTFNTILAVCAKRGERYSWILQEMAASGVQPDAYTVCTMLKQQRSLTDARGIWRWGRKRDAALGIVAWHHLIEAHIRLGQPGRCAALLQLMESRDGLRAQCVRSHNLYLRALVAEGRPEAAIAHFERMCVAASATRPAAPAAFRPGYDGADDYGFALDGGEMDEDDGALATEAADEAEEGAGSGGPVSRRRRPLWLQRRPPPPDDYSYAIALTALRSVDLGDAGDASGAMPGARLRRRKAGGGKSDRAAARSEKARRLLVEAEARGLWGEGEGNAEPIPAAVAHALVCACRDDTETAIALWREHLRPRLLAMRQDGAPRYNPPGTQPTAEQAAYHALLRVCGAAARPDDALRIVYAMKQDGFPADASCFSAYSRGKEAATARAGILQAGYERLLKLELAPERVEGPRLGSIEKIRIQFS
jgi:pentatricopeptide repeat protein